MFHLVKKAIIWQCGQMSANATYYEEAGIKFPNGFKSVKKVKRHFLSIATTKIHTLIKITT